MQFERYIGIDYSGAETPNSSLKSLRAYESSRGSIVAEVPPPPTPKWYWTRKALAQWLSETLGNDRPVIIGIDHAFSFPVAYFKKHRIARDWDTFLDDFCEHWPTDRDNMYVDFVRNGNRGIGYLRQGSRKWRRVTEVNSGSAKSVFHFDVQGTVAKSTHSGIPWLRFLRREKGSAVHFWPFDGWEIPEGKHAIVEVYPRLWKDLYPAEDRNGDQQDAYAVCRWLQESDANGELKKALAPELPAEVRKIASFEGWILGVKYDNSLKPAARPGRASRRTPKRSNAAAIHKERGALLCVDDEPSILAALEWEFRSEGFENILVASDGEEALRILTEHGDRVQVMTTNIRMPKLDGLSLIRHLAAHHRHPLVVIVISGVVSFEAAIQFMRSRSDVVVPFDYINKPYDPEHVVKRVRDAFAVAEYLRMK